MLGQIVDGGENPLLSPVIFQGRYLRVLGQLVFEEVALVGTAVGAVATLKGLLPGVAAEVPR